jgi:hypothetical protein
MSGLFIPLLVLSGNGKGVTLRGQKGKSKENLRRLSPYMTTMLYIFDERPFLVAA